MADIFAGYEPKRLYDFLYDVFSTPRPSGHEEKMAEYVVRFARERGLEYVEDELHNVLVKKPASAGMEMLPPVLIEGHMDMVAVKAPDSRHDFLKDPIELIVEDGWVRGNGTTLGADNGCAVAVMLTLLDQEGLVHPPLECLFTVQEELGMLGADAFDLRHIKARRVIGLDAGSEGVFRKGVSSKYYEDIRFPVQREALHGKVYRLEVSGLKGGSPSEAVQLDRAYGVKLMGRVLYRLVLDYDARIQLVEKGKGEDCAAVFAVADAAETELTDLAGAMQEAMRSEYAESEPDIVVQIKKTSAVNPLPMTAACSRRLAAGLYLIPFGAFRRVLERGEEPRCFCAAKTLATDESGVILGIVVSTDKRSIGIALKEEIRALASILGAELVRDEFDFGWDPEEHSPLREAMRRTYFRLFGTYPVINVSHGGNDCVVIKKKLPEFDVVTTAATYPDYHTVNERLDLESLSKVYDLVEKTLEELCRQE